MDSKPDPKKTDPKSEDDEPKGPPPPPPVGAVASPMDTFRKMIRTKHA